MAKSVKLSAIADSAAVIPSPTPPIIPPTKLPMAVPIANRNSPPLLMMSVAPGILDKPPNIAINIPISAMIAATPRTPSKAGAINGPTPANTGINADTKANMPTAVTIVPAVTASCCHGMPDIIETGIARAVKATANATMPSAEPNNDPILVMALNKPIVAINMLMAPAAAINDVVSNRVNNANTPDKIPIPNANAIIPPAETPKSPLRVNFIKAAIAAIRATTATPPCISLFVSRDPNTANAPLIANKPTPRPMRDPPVTAKSLPSVKVTNKANVVNNANNAMEPFASTSNGVLPSIAKAPVMAIKPTPN